MSTVFTYSSIAFRIPPSFSYMCASNLCALITPCGALSSLMFMRICKENEVKICYLDYMKFAPLGIVLLVIGIGLIIVF